jgi:hypothetical protein
VCARTIAHELLAGLVGGEAEVKLEEELQLVRAVSVAAARPLFVLAQPRTHTAEARQVGPVVEPELRRLDRQSLGLICSIKR